MDERLGTGYRPRVHSPIKWDHVPFIPADHIGLTKRPVLQQQRAV